MLFDLDLRLSAANDLPTQRKRLENSSPPTLAAQLRARGIDPKTINLVTTARRGFIVNRA